MKNIFRQKQSVSKDHYQLPEDDQLNFDPIQSDEEIGPHSRILINNFNENARIKINIFINEQQSQKSKTVGKWQKKSVIDPFVTNQKEVNSLKSNRRENTQTVKKLPQIFNQSSETPLKHPQYRYDHTYTRNNPQTIKPNREIDQDKKNSFQGHQAKQNLFQTDIRNKRYYNTQVFPPNKSLIKAAQISERQKQHKEQIRKLLLQMNTVQKLERQNQRVDSSSSIFQQKAYWMPSELKQKSFFNASIVQQTKNQHFIQQNQLDKFEINSMNKQSYVGEQKVQDHSQSQGYRIQEQNKDQEIQVHESLSEIESQNNHFQQLEQSSIPKKQAEQFVAHTYESRLQEQINENIRLDVENKQSEELEQRSEIQQQTYTVSVEYQQNYQQDSESEVSEQNKHQKQQISIQYQTRPQISYKVQNQDEPLQLEFQGDVSVQSSNQNQPQTIYIQIQANESSSMQEEQDQATDSQHTNQKAIQIDHLSSINIISPRDTQITPQKVGFINFFSLQQKEHSSNDFSNIKEEKQSQPIFQHQVLKFDHQHDEKPLERNEVDSLKLQFTFSPSRENYQNESQRGSYKQLQKYKRLFKNQQTNPQSLIQSAGLNKNTKDKEENYSRKSSSKSQSKFTPFSSKSSLHHQKQHCFNSNQPQPFKLKDYSGSSSSSSYLHSDRNLRKVQKQQSIDHNKIERQQRKQPKIVKINLKDKTAEDLFTKHKNEFLNKLKHQEKLSNRLISHSPTSKQKITSTKLNISNTQQRSSKQQSPRNRPLSPYIQQLTDRLYSPTSSPVCQHYKKYSRRNLRSKFLDMVEQDPYSMLKQYYFSQEELNQVFVEEILKNELNQIYWIEVVKKYGERKLQNLRLRSKAKYHPNENRIIRQEQKLSDSKRTFVNHPYKMNFLNQKVKLKS